MNKGQCVTKYYRWIQKNGGYIWIQSSATIAINAKNANEKNIIWVNYVLRSEVNDAQNDTCIMTLSMISITEYALAQASSRPVPVATTQVSSSPVTVR